MKKYICDICGKEFGHNVSTFIQPIYSPKDFQFDSGFYITQKYDSDICNECFNRVAEAQQKEIEKIKEEGLKENEKSKKNQTGKNT